MTSLGEWKFEMPLAESTMASSGRCSWQACRSRMISSRCECRQRLDLAVEIGQPVVDVHAQFVEQLLVLGEGVLVEDLHRVAEDDGVD